MISLTLVRRRLDFFDPKNPFKTKPDFKNYVQDEAGLNAPIFLKLRLN